MLWLLTYALCGIDIFAPSPKITDRSQSKGQKMPHYHTEGFENSWQIVRETPNSQKWRVTTTTGNNLQIDIHYTAEKILTANIVADSPFSKSMMTSVFNEIGRLGLYRGDYGVIDYTFSESSNTHDGNYGIDDKDREFRQL